MSKSHALPGIIVKLALVAAIWGGTFIAGRIATTQMPPETAAFWRYVVATLALVVAAVALEGGLPRLNRRQWIAVTLLGATGVFAYNLCFMVGLKTVTAGRASLIVALNPALVMLGSALAFGERIERQRLVGVALAFAGAATVIGHGNPLALLDGAAGAGEVLIFGCAVSWMAFTLIAKRVMTGLSPLAMTTYASITGTLMLAAAVAATGATFAPHPSLAGIASLAFLGVFGTAVAFVWFNDGVRILGPVRAGVFINLVPVAAIALGALVLGESIDLPVIAGGALVIAGVWILNRVPPRVPTPATA
jgi:drug/metabolite transporter (DMT)-like permease